MVCFTTEPAVREPSLRRSLQSIRILTVAAALFTCRCIPTLAQSFTWDNAVIYFVMIDRFANGDSTNDHSYGRGLDDAGSAVHADSPGRFFGGDLRGLTAKVDEGYFSNLGVNAIWISSPLEQVHGWVGGGDGAYPAYGYHGYWPLDFTRIDQNVGNEDDLRQFIRACHRRGIRVVMDVVVNHAGYNTLRDMSELGFGSLKGTGWQDWTPGRDENWHSYHESFIDYGDSTAWSTWWGTSWIRANIAGYAPCGDTDQTTCTSSLPDFRTESDERVRLPAFLARKWAREGGDASASDSVILADYPPATVREHLTEWVSAWVRRLGIDGFRLDTARNLDLPTIRHLKTGAVEALRAWKRENTSEALDELDFWMVGEVFGHGVEHSDYLDNGLDAVINFDFQRDLDRGIPLDSIYSAYAASIGADPTLSIVSYLSSHDTQLFNRSRLQDAATALMLAPGNVQIFYGDETGRPPLPAPAEGAERTRSPMNWDAPDTLLLAQWQRLGQFRARHPSVALGSHEVLSTDPYVFSRTYGLGDSRDQVIVVLGEPGRVRINVSKLLGDNVILRDAYTGRTAFVSFGMVHVEVAESGVALLEVVR